MHCFSRVGAAKCCVLLNYKVITMPGLLLLLLQKENRSDPRQLTSPGEGAGTSRIDVPDGVL